MAECPAVGKLVRALYMFKGSNNDELCFRKGDVITITQSVEGGWWEGTLNGKTGWFPSNYVTESPGLTVTSDVKPVTFPKPPSMADVKRTSVLHYHQMVVQSLVETERVYVNELQQLIQSYLHPIHTAHYLDQQQYSHLVGNIDELVTFHQDSLNKLEACVTLPHLQQRVGGLFLKMVPQLKQLYEAYFSNHPWAVQVMLSKKDDLNMFMESKGIPSPGTMELTTCLSKPFARLDQYCSTLKELERHIEDCHPDRGDTQRALAVCKDIQTGCIELRKQKEVECEIMSGTIDGCHDEVTSSLGSLLYLGNVMLVNDAGEKKHSVLAVFQHQVLFLYISSCMSGYEYQGCLPLTTVVVNVLDDSEPYKHAFELSSGKEKRTVVCSNTADRKRWIDLLSQHTGANNNTVPIVAPVPVVGVTGGGVSTTQSTVVVPPKSLTQVEVPKPALSPKPLKQQTDTVTTVAHCNNNQPNGRVWSMSCLRPSAPLRPTFYNKDGGGQQSPRTIRKTYSQRRKAVEDMKTMEEDAVILQVIEAYCTSSRTRHTVNSLDLSKLRREDDPQQQLHVKVSSHPAPTSSPQHQGKQIQPQPAPICNSTGQHQHHHNCPNRHMIPQPGQEQADYERLQRGVMRGFCCGSFPGTKSIAKALKRL